MVQNAAEVSFEWKRGYSPQAMTVRLGLFHKRSRDELKAALEDCVKRVTERAKSLAPVDTGRLRDSITGYVQELAVVQMRIKAIVGSEVEYAGFQEYGTRYMGAQPYLRPALEAERAYITERYKQAVDRAARSVGFL